MFLIDKDIARGGNSGWHGGNAVRRFSAMMRKFFKILFFLFSKIILLFQEFSWKFQIFFNFRNEIFKNFSKAEPSFARLRLQGLQKDLAARGASSLRLHIPVNNLCKIFLSEESNILILQCCHVSTWLKCTLFSDKCQMCRCEIIGTIKIFFFALNTNSSFRAPRRSLHSSYFPYRKEKFP